MLFGCGLSVTKRGKTSSPASPAIKKNRWQPRALRRARVQSAKAAHDSFAGRPRDRPRSRARGSLVPRLAPRSLRPRSWCRGRAHSAPASPRARPSPQLFLKGEGITYPIHSIGFCLRIAFRLISQKAKYALRALVALAKEGDSLMIGEIAARKNIPRKLLELILLEMKRQAWRLQPAHAAGKDHLWAGVAHHRRADCPPAVLEPHRLPALFRLPERGSLRNQTGFCQGRRVGQIGARPHDHRRFPQLFPPRRRA